MSNYKIIFISLALSFLILVAISGFLFYKKNYLKYNLLRLDPLEELTIDPKLLLTDNKVPDIWLLGDSRIAHWNTKHFDTFPANIVNLGIEGQSTKQILERLKSHLERGTPDWIILEAGINDLKVIGLNEDLSEKTANQCYNNIISIFTLCNKKNIKVICCSIFPIGNIEIPRRLIWNSAIEKQINKVNKKLEGYCQNNNIEFYNVSNILLGTNFRIKQNFQSGFLHINDKAYSLLTKELISKFGDKIIRTN